MIDVNKITSTLAKLPDQQLQQYAQMHKSDPYIMALAMSESNRRKEMRSAGQGGQGAQEQPKVVDQLVAEMAPQQLPEDQGIGQLPAGDMNFADGGIIAFAGGGDVERYQFGGMPPRTSMMGDIPGFVAGTPIFQTQPGAPEEEPILRRLYREMNERNVAAREEEERRRVAQGRAAPSEKMLAQAAATQANPAQDMAQFDAASNLYMTERAAKQAAAKGAPTPEPAPKVDAAPARTTSAGAIAAPALNLNVAGLTEKAMGAAVKQPNPFAADVESIGKEKVAAKEAELSGLEAVNKQFSDIYKGRKERLDKKEGDVEKMKDQGLGLALLQAGAAMMSTRGGLGMALGKGVEVGTQQYASGLDRVRSAQEKLSDARDRLEEVEAQRGELSARELNKARNEIKTAGIGARDDLLKANMQMYGVNRETALKMVDNQIKVGISQYEQQQQTARSNAQVAASGRNNQIELLEAVSKDPKLAAAYKAMHGKGEDVMGQYNDFLKANPALAMDPKAAVTQFLMTKSVFSQLGGGTVTDKPLQKLRTQP